MLAIASSQVTDPDPSKFVSPTDSSARRVAEDAVAKRTAKTDT